MISLIRTAVERGVTFFDTAEIPEALEKRTGLTCALASSVRD